MEFLFAHTGLAIGLLAQVSQPAWQVQVLHSVLVTQVRQAPASSQKIPISSVKQ